MARKLIKEREGGNRNILNSPTFIIGIMVLLSLSINFISAFGVSSAYYDNNPLSLSRGETKEFYLTLQNMAGSLDVTAQADILDGSEIIEIIDSDKVYFIPLGTKAIVNLRVNVPEDAEIGQVYSVGVSFTTRSETETGEFGFGSSVVSKFQVVVVPTAEESAELAQQELFIKNMWIVIIVVIVVAVVVFLIFVNKKKTKFKSKKR